MTREELAAMLYIEAADLLMEGIYDNTAPDASHPEQKEKLSSIDSLKECARNAISEEDKVYWLRNLPTCINRVTKYCPEIKNSLLAEFNKVKSSYKKDRKTFNTSLTNIIMIARKAQTGK